MVFSFRFPIKILISVYCGLSIYNPLKRIHVQEHDKVFYIPFIDNRSTNNPLIKSEKGSRRVFFLMIFPFPLLVLASGDEKVT